VTPAFRYALLWVAGSVAMVGAALTMLSGGYVDGTYVPSNPDAFYHARRILDLALGGGPLLQFDGLIHHPEGSWIPWPWGFDTVLAIAVERLGPFADERAAAAALMHLPLFAAPAAVALLVLLLRQLQVSLAASALATFGFALLPIVFLAFAVGNVDHHFAELLWTLLVLCSGVAFFRSAGVAAAAGLGIVLGSAVAVHNGLFVLQVPLVGAFVGRWWLRLPLPPARAVFAFAAALAGVTLLVCVPSESWQRGAFEFFTLSWFHVYVAACTASLLVLLTHVRPRVSSAAWLLFLALVGAMPLLGALGLGSQFVGGDLDYLRDITEAQSPYELYALFGSAQSTRLFSSLMWLSLPALAVNGYWAIREREPGLQFYAVAAVLLLGLLQLQFRFGILGIAPLLVTLARLVDLAAGRWSARPVLLTATLGLIVALAPTRDIWTTPRAPGGDPFYADMLPGLMRLRDACAQRPGVVLAPVNDGHWVRYHTSCSVIGNVFLLTEQDARKRLEVEALLATPAFRLHVERPDIAYVLVHGELELYVPVLADGSHGQGVLRWKRDTLPALTRALLGAEEDLPSGYRALWTTYLPDGEVLGRLLALER
jgi:hypothetical protein